MIIIIIIIIIIIKDKGTMDKFIMYSFLLSN